MDKPLVVMGNGPSLKDIDFKSLKGCDTFGLNLAYRAYPRMDWLPTYHGCFDRVVTANHAEAFKTFVESNPEIKRFFYLQQVSDDPRVQKIGLLPRSTPKWNSTEADLTQFKDNGNSGVNACSVGVCLGYTKIILVGVDCKYVDMVDGAKKKGGHLIMDKTPDKNPNYWFDDYQQKGDEYNLPNVNVYHKPAWETFAISAEEAGIEVVNCSDSTLECFRKSTLEKEL